MGNLTLTTCPRCNGTGKTKEKSSGENGQEYEIICPTCAGSGKNLIGEEDSDPKLDHIIKLLKKILKKLDIDDKEEICQ